MQSPTHHFIREKDQLECMVLEDVKEVIVRIGPTCLADCTLFVPEHKLRQFHNAIGAFLEGRGPSD